MAQRRARPRAARAAFGYAQGETPYAPFRGLFGVWPGGARGGPFWAFFEEIPQNGGFWGLEPRRGLPATRPGDRAPARGVDVKPPLAQRGRIPDPGVSPGPPGPQDPPGSGTGPEALLGPSQAPGRPGDLLRGGCFTSTPRAGALSPSREPLPGSGEPPPLRRGGQGGVPPPLGRGGGTPRREVGGQAAGF